MKKSLPTDEEDFNAELQSLKLSKGPAASKWKEVCGNFYLHVSIWDASSSEEKVVEFDTLQIQKECNDKPALSLNVNLRTKKNAGYPSSGMINPFKTIGVDSIEIVNNGETDMAARWGTDIPDVLAFFVPLGLNESCEI